MDVRRRIKTIIFLKKIETQPIFCEKTEIKDASGYIARDGQSMKLEKKGIRK